MSRHTDGLRGMDTICEYTGYSRRVVCRLAKEHGLPVAIIGGKWESSRELVDQWRKQMLMAGGEQN